MCSATAGQAAADDVVVLQLEKLGKPLPPVVVELFEGDAPKHAANFKKLMGSGFYLKTSVHRLLPNALLQMGDPISRKKDAMDLGTGGPGYTLPPEIKHKHTEGCVAMGRLPDNVNPGKVSNGSQFYFALKALPELDGTDTVFGRVIQGMDTLQTLGSGTADSNDVPLERIAVTGSKVVPREKLEAEMAALTKGPSFWRRVGGHLPKLF
jgi:cyclophilin family peptidyl-prolyl cis-trans isomerase